MRRDFPYACKVEGEQYTLVDCANLLCSKFRVCYRVENTSEEVQSVS